jgi:hypothetical protein
MRVGEINLGATLERQDRSMPYREDPSMSRLANLMGRERLSEHDPLVQAPPIVVARVTRKSVS